MPGTYTYPGVYIEEVPSGVRTITGVATSITAFVGYTARGPVNDAVRIFNMGDYERNFGGLHRDSLTSYAVQQFFLNGGSDAYVVRVASGAAPATATLADIAGTDVLEVSSANAGGWGNFVRLSVDYGTSNPDSTFNLTIRRYEQQNGQFVLLEQEQFRNLSMNSRSPTYAVNTVNSGSNLVELTRESGLTFARGFSLSDDLSTFPALTSSNTAISGVLNGDTAFSLALTSVPANIGELETAVTAAIATAGLANHLQAGRADADGSDNGTGDHLKLTSLEVAGETSTEDEHSSVAVFRAANNDAAVLLTLGVDQGGREVSGASGRRPAPHGTLGENLAAQIGDPIGGGVDPLHVVVEDHSSGSAVEIVSADVPLPATTIGPALRTELQTAIRSIGDPATQNAEVQLDGSRLHIVSSADTPNATITITDTGAGTDAATLGLPAAAGPTLNVQQYNLGSGAIVGAQTAVSLGTDGAPPGAIDYLGSYADKTGIYALRDVDLFNLMAIPGTSQLSDTAARSVIAAAISFCEQERAFYLVDPMPNSGPTDVGDWVSQVGTSKNAAVYFPQVQIADALANFRLANHPPSGTLCGVIARTDAERGVWKAPAGTEAALRGVQGLVHRLTDQENGVLNQLGINVLRTFPVYGRVAWGSRTLQGADALASEWKYIPVRRMALFIEESLFRGTQWVVFEPNAEPLWGQIRLNIGAFMHNLFRQGAFKGTTPRQAYFVKCDAETTTANDINNGIVNIVVGFAPLKPAEFVIIKIQQIADEIQT